MSANAPLLCDKVIGGDFSKMSIFKFLIARPGKTLRENYRSESETFRTILPV